MQRFRQKACRISIHDRFICPLRRSKRRRFPADFGRQQFQSFSDFGTPVQILDAGCAKQTRPRCKGTFFSPGTVQYGRTRWLSDKSRNPSDFPKHTFQRTVCLITAEKLVSSVSAQRHCHMLLRHPADKVGRYLRGIRKRFSEHGSQFRYLLGFFFRNIKFRMLRSEMLRNFFGSFGLVKVFFPHTDGITSYTSVTY